MEFLPTKSILKIPADAVAVIRREVNLDRPGEIEEAVRILEEWINQQAHYTRKDIPKPYLESTIVACKGSVERAKKIIDKLCTLRSLMPEEFKPLNVRTDSTILDDKTYMVILPKQTADYHRLAIAKTTVYTPDILRLFYRFCYMLVDYIRLYDYQRGTDLIYDLSDSDIKEALTSINLSEFKNCYEIVNHSYSLRLRRIIVLTSSKWVEPLVNMFKAFMKKKIADRIVIHKTYDELYQYYSKDILPKEYGGNERCFKELQEELFTHISSEEHTEFMNNISNAKTDESKRPQHVFNDLYAGTAGTFRSLRID